MLRNGVFIILTAVKSIFIHLRSSVKLIAVIAIAAILIVGIISYFYKPVYAVVLKGEVIGYTDDKTELQKKLNDYMVAGNENNVAFIDIDTLPEYDLCFVKKETVSDDNAILSKIEEAGKVYYQYFAIVESEKEKYYVATKEEAEKVIDDLKAKKSTNSSKIAYKEVFGEELKEFTETDKIVTALYKKPVSSYYGGSGSYTMAYEKVDLGGITLATPVKNYQCISSRFGGRGFGLHTGLDVAAPMGAAIYAAAAGTVVKVQYLTTSYGYHIIIDHGNGVSTLYGHCSSMSVTVGQTVAQGQYIGAVGSTGNSTGPHLHFEVRKDNKRIDPQNYVY